MCEVACRCLREDGGQPSSPERGVGNAGGKGCRQQRGPRAHEGPASRTRGEGGFREEQDGPIIVTGGTFGMFLVQVQGPHGTGVGKMTSSPLMACISSIDFGESGEVGGGWGRF